MVIVHEQKWVAGSDRTITGDIADELVQLSGVPERAMSSERIVMGNLDFEDMSPLDAFLHMMPPEQLTLVLELSNERLAAKGKKEFV